jgi:hypothetical protein
MRSTNLSQVGPQQGGSLAMVPSGSNSASTEGSAFSNLGGNKDGRGGSVMSAKMINSGGAGNAGLLTKEKEGESNSQAAE